ncbi:MAG: hypothetical protein KAS29_11635, partial [Bacteroidales bacterium]|nr:hypothetical protein [Bacteroidales bacterium]
SVSSKNLKNMKRNPVKNMSITLIFSFFFLVQTNGQNPTEVNQQLLDMKLKLLNSQIELFNSQLKVWETKPLELEQKLTDVDQRIDQLDFDPVYFNTKLHEIELSIEDFKVENKKPKRKGLQSFRPDSVITVPYKTAIAINPIRLFEGTFHITYERSITSKIGLSISGFATYATEEGISSFYMMNQSLAYFNASLDSSLPYNAQNISGYGIGLAMKNYLLTDVYKKLRSPVGLYAAPNLLFRRLWLSGMSEYYLEDEWIEEEVTQLLNIFALGAHIGWKFTFVKVLYLDMYIGGQIRLAKYDNEDSFTRYKSLGNIDYSGVMPTAGLSIGILK